MATMTGLDAATRARLIREKGATDGLLSYLEDEGYDPSQIVAAFDQMSVEAIARRVGYDLAADPDHNGGQSAGAAPDPAPRARSAPAAPAAPARRAPRRRKGNGDTYRRVIYGLSLAFGLVMASLMWRVDGYFGVAFLQRVPGLTTLPNTVLWPPVWTWLIGLGVSAMQGAFWPRRAKHDEAGELVEEGSAPQEIITWLVVLFANVASSALGMMPTIKGLDLGGVVVPEAGWGLWLTSWVLAGVFALYPEWATRVFGGRLWDVLVPDSLKHRIKAFKSGVAASWAVLMSLLPSSTRGRMIAGGVAGGLVVILFVWSLLA